MAAPAPGYGGPEAERPNPFGMLPVLAMANGSHLVESRAIIDYLEEVEPDASLCVGNADERARQRDLERIADLGVLIPIVEVVQNTRSPLGLPPNRAVARYFRERLAEPLEFLDEFPRLREWSERYRSRSELEGILLA